MLMGTLLQTKLKRLEEERREAEASDKEREAELVRLKLVVAEAEKVKCLSCLRLKLAREYLECLEWDGFIQRYRRTGQTGHEM